MDSLQSSFLSPTPHLKTHQTQPINPNPTTRITCSVSPDPWTLSDGNPTTTNTPKPRWKNPKNPLSDDNARRIIKAKARYLSTLRRNQGPQAQTPRWVRRSPEQMVQYLEDDRHGHLYGKHVVAAIQLVRSLSQKSEGSYDMRKVMGSFVTKLTFREMCVVLKEQRSWRQVRDFFAWMKLQLCYRPCVISYTIVLRAYGQVGKIKLAEETFIEMLDAGCEPDEIACGTMLCTYARWGRHRAMLTFYMAVQERGVLLSVAVYNFMLSSLQKKSLHQNVIQIYRDMVDKRVVPNHFTFTVVICSFVKEGFLEEGMTTFSKMKSLGFVPEEVTYSLLISSNVKTGNQEEVLRLYEDMRYQDIIPSNFTCASLLTLYYKNGDYSKALSLFSEMERYRIRADEVIYGLLVRIYGKLGLCEDAEKTFKEAGRYGMLSDEKTYVAMAQAYLSSGDYVKALQTMEVMKSRKISISKFGYTILMKCYMMKEDLGSAEATFQSLSGGGLLDSRSCNDMLNMFLRQGLLEKAKNFIVQIRKDNVVFDEDLCRKVMMVYSKEGMLKETEQFIEEICGNGPLENNRFIQTVSIILYAQDEKNVKEKGRLLAPGLLDNSALELMLCLYISIGDVSKTEYTLGVLIEAADGLSVVNQLIRKFIHEGDSFKAEALYNILIKRDSRAHGGILAPMISLYGKQQKLEKAKELFAAAANSAICEAEIYNSVIDACVKCHEPGEGYSIFKESTKRGVSLSPFVISVLVNNLTNRGMHHEAEDVVYRSLHDNLILDTIAYNTFIKAMMEAGKLHFAASIYDRMLSVGVSLSIQTYSTMISVYGRQKNLHKALEMFNTAQTLGVPLDEKVYTNLISIFGKSGKAQEASAMFTKMREEGLKPGKISYNVMINVYAAAGLDAEATELFKDMQKDGQRPDSLTYLALMKAYAESMKHREAEETIILMEKEGIRPSCAHYNLLISVFAKVGLIEEADRVFNTMLASGLKPDIVCCNNMLRSYMKYGYVEKGISFFESIQKYVEPDRFTMSAAVHLYKSAGEDARAEAILSFMNDMDMPFLRSIEIRSKEEAARIVKVLDDEHSN